MLADGLTGVPRGGAGQPEARARRRGALLIRLDTFSWQGRDFYPTLGYEKVGSYDAPEYGFSEYFYLKRLGPAGE